MSGGSGSTSQRAGTHLETLAVHGGEPEAGYGGAVVVPVFQSSTYLVGEAGTPDQVRYIRWNNTPNHEVLHRRLALLEGGEDALVTASGMAAISASLLAVLQPGDHLVVQQSLYGGTFEFVWRFLPVWGVRVSWFDPVRPETLQVALEARTRAVLVESISNPLLEIADLPAVVEIARAAGVILMVDNTFATPVNFRPLEHGFDLVLHSCTKYLNGHSDLVAGAAVGSSELISSIRHKLMLLGGCLDPHACFLLERGLKTLVLRVRQQNRTASVVAGYLEKRSEVRRVFHPSRDGWGSPRGKAWFGGYGGMVSFELEGGGETAAKFMAALRIPKDAPSLGGVESLVTRPVITSHSSLKPEERAELGITDGLIRLSLGIEAVEDILADLEQAFAAL
ncbi:MAG TPA: PLP-dependent aspartate aminotransferase family protein [Acidobacteriota bacterium]|jgi:cystathionine gamma-synthase/cystathionine gamma-lyase/cystathionine beta-lyase|nr:PLP-dependent aspartate aminotransferase family protein [Acidobacteriota bacterium]HRV07519.1 PLP-dependent aspartate aminotransferase family protein [Acidobacteriota bacterium]